MAITRLEKLLKSGTSGRLGELVETARERQDLAGRLRAAVGPELGAAIVAAGIEAGELAVVASSPAWASRLRFEEALLREAATADGEKVNGVRVRVARGADQA